MNCPSPSHPQPGSIVFGVEPTLTEPGMATSLTLRPDDVLIVTDVQNDFCPGGALAVPDGDAIVPPIDRLAERFGHVVLTQDWHPPGHDSFASSHPGRRPFETGRSEEHTSELQSLM